MTRFRSAWVLAAGLVLAAESGIGADVLILRDGRRIEGMLTGVRGDTVEFEPRTGRDQGRVVRYERADVRALEFDDGWSGNRYREDNRYRAPASSPRCSETDPSEDHQRWPA